MSSFLRTYSMFSRYQGIFSIKWQHAGSYVDLCITRKLCSRNGTHFTFEDRIDVKPRSKLLLETTGMHIHITNLLTLGWFINMSIDGSIQQPQSPSNAVPADCNNTGVQIQTEDDGNVIHIVNKKSNSDTSVLIPTLRLKVPVDLEVNVNTFERGNVILDNVHARNLSCCTRDGDIIGENIQCKNFNAVSTNGNVICRGPILGNVQVNVSGDGRIALDRVQGMKICLQSESGDIQANAIYSENTFMSSSNASINLANLHGDSIVNVGLGNLHLAGVSGSLTANVAHGDVDVHVSKLFPTSHVMIVCNMGNTRLSLTENLVTRLRLEGVDVEVAESLRGHRVTESRTNAIIYEGHLNGEQLEQLPFITARAPTGKIVVKTENWLSSLNLTNKIHPEHPTTTK